MFLFLQYRIVKRVLKFGGSVWNCCAYFVVLTCMICPPQIIRHSECLLEFSNGFTDWVGGLTYLFLCPISGNLDEMNLTTVFFKRLNHQPATWLTPQPAGWSCSLQAARQTEKRGIPWLLREGWLEDLEVASWYLFRSIRLRSEGICGYYITKHIIHMYVLEVWLKKSYAKTNFQYMWNFRPWNQKWIQTISSPLVVLICQESTLPTQLRTCLAELHPETGSHMIFEQPQDMAFFFFPAQGWQRWWFHDGSIMFNKPKWCSTKLMLQTWWLNLTPWTPVFFGGITIRVPVGVAKVGILGPGSCWILMHQQLVFHWRMVDPHFRRWLFWNEMTSLWNDVRRGSGTRDASHTAFAWSCFGGLAIF